jgi:L-serine dehydratase
MKTSLFEIFKIGIGPSSSHTVGPMRAAAAFVTTLKNKNLFARVQRIQADLCGSLALTGRGHGTDRAILLGLTGELPDEIEPDKVESLVEGIRSARFLVLGGVRRIPFDESGDLLFHKDAALPTHPNGMIFRAYDEAANELAKEVYYSTGGGFIKSEAEMHHTGDDSASTMVPYPFKSAADLLRIGEENKLTIWRIVLENEMRRHSESQIRAFIERIWETMHACMLRGVRTEGILPGGLNIRRRAPRFARRLEEVGQRDPLHALDWVNVFAMAVNEENAAGGRVVTAPTNGAAGVIPAVAEYYRKFVDGASQEGVFRFFLTAGAIGILYKENASISGAEVGCQGEVGVACSMAAGGLVAALNGTNQEVEYAAEIGMEHNLGMTCDPIGGLVQIPCIERNAMGAVKAINACRIAFREGGEHKVSLDQVIKTMYETGRDMQSRYKETSLGGLATLNIIEC